MEIIWLDFVKPICILCLSQIFAFIEFPQITFRWNIRTIPLRPKKPIELNKA